MNTLLSMSSGVDSQKEYSNRNNTEGWRLVGISGGLNPMPLPNNKNNMEKYKFKSETIPFWMHELNEMLHHYFSKQ